MSKSSQPAPAKPRFDVFVIDNWTDAGGAEKATWIRVGVAFPHTDGDGFQIELKALPTNGKLVVRAAKAQGE